MSGRRVSVLLRKDLALGPRSPVFLYALVFPVLATLLVQLVFGSLFDPDPRLGIVDEGRSEISTTATELEGIRVTMVGSAGELKEMVEANDLDAGLVLPAGFDAAVRAGDKPPLEFYVGGESLTSNRLILAVTTLDLVRGLQGEPPPVDVVITSLGDEEALPVASRLIPAMVIFALLISGVFVTGFSLVEERERGTLDAVLVTPVKMTDVLVAKSTLGIVLAMLMAIVTLLLNQAFGSHPGALLLALFLGALTCTEIGLIYGTASKDTNTLFTLVKTLNILLVGPVIFYLFPSWPQWVAKFFPTYWFLDPIFQVAMRGAGLADVWLELVVASAICVVLAIVVAGLGRRMQASLATE